MRPEGSSVNPEGRTRAEGLLLRQTVFVAEAFGERRHVAAYLFIGDLRVDLGGENIGVPQHLRYGLQRYALRERDGRGECVAGDMHRDMLFQPAIPCDTLQCAVHVVADRRHGKDEVVFRCGTVVFDQLLGDGQQFDMERRSGFLTVRDDSAVPVERGFNMIEGQFLHI